MTTKAGTPFDTEDEAAVAAIEEINPLSIKNNWEYAGRIYQMPNGKFSYTLPITLKKKALSDPGPKVLGAGVKNIGTYHTHGAHIYDTDEQFSPADMVKATMGKEISYLGTPNGDVLKYYPFDLLSSVGREKFPKGFVKIIQAAPVIITSSEASP